VLRLFSNSERRLKVNRKTIKADSSKNILEQMGQETLSFYSPCGGTGSCGKCRVLVKGSTSPPTEVERKNLSAQEIDNGIRLACQAYAVGDVEVFWDSAMTKNDSKSQLVQGGCVRLDPKIRVKLVGIVQPDMQNGNTTAEAVMQAVGKRKINMDALRVLSNERSFPASITVVEDDCEIVDVRLGADRGRVFGVAVDIGTTTVACYLIDLTTGRQVSVASGQNAQCIVGADVISRIQYTLEKDGGLQELQQKIVETIDGLVGKMIKEFGIEPFEVMQCVLVGNTTMHHIFWGLGCNSLARMPFNAVTRSLVVAKIGDIGFTHMNRRGRVDFLPGIAGFVGADTTGAMLAAGLEHTKDIGLLLDLGTNGEIVLWTSTGRYACSTAAGPAFEGARIQHGMQAFDGAINTAKIEDDLYFTTVGGAPARGICGSGLVDLVSELCKAGVIHKDGKIAESTEVAEGKLAARMIKNGRQKEIVIVYPRGAGNSDGIVLTQKDIRELQLAKGAIRAGINILLKVAGISIGDVERLLLAGAFGNFIDKSSARTIGILPDIDLNKVIALGNAAGEGAKMALCDWNMIGVAETLAFGTQHIEIASHPDFQDEFIEGMRLA